jgi:5-methylcytosine-specific restriction endonuclease McrA
MSKRNQSTYWRTFARQKDLVAAVRAVVDPAPYYSAFGSELISDLLAERHYYCHRHGIRVTRFKKTHEDQPYRFYADFPSIGWHPVSWTKCAKQSPTRETVIRDALRQSTEAGKTAYRQAHPICEGCGRVPSVETHHVRPTFAEIVAAVFASVTEADRESALKNWNFFDPQPFALPLDHVIQREFDSRHRTARLAALCKTCHDTTKGKGLPSTGKNAEHE